MKLIFEKDRQKNILVKIKDGAVKKKFFYIEMIKSLWNKNKFEDPEFVGEINQDEKESLNEMLSKINLAITERKETTAD